MKEYELQFSSKDTSSVDVGFNTLVAALSAFTSSAKYTTYLFATGQSATQNTNPSWLRSLIGFTCVFERSRESSLCFRAPTLNHATAKQFAQKDLFERHPNLGMDATSVDLVHLSIEELLSDQSVGDAYDENVLTSLLRFQHLRSSHKIELSIRPIEYNRSPYTLNFDENLFESCTRRSAQIPLPSRHIIVGKLNEIGHRRRQFLLDIRPNQKIIGRLSSSFDGLETMRTLWGHQATVIGSVHYKVDGTPRFIEADQVLPRQKGDDVFQKIPKPMNWHGTVLPKKTDGRQGSLDLSALIGSWPGDEPIEQLMAELKNLGR